MEFSTIYRRQEAGTHPAEVCSPDSKSLFNASSTYEDFLTNFLSFILYMTKDVFLDALFLSPVYSGLNCCPSLLHATGIRVPLCNFRNRSLFFATSKNSPTARCVLAANLVYNDVDFFRNTISLLKQILN